MTRFLAVLILTMSVPVVPGALSAQTLNQLPEAGTHLEEYEEGRNYMADTAGVYWTRRGVYWRDVEGGATKPSTRDWSRYDSLFAQWRERTDENGDTASFEILPVLAAATPQWAAVPPDTQCTWSASPWDASYSYRWFKDGTQVATTQEYSFLTPGSGSFVLEVEVTDDAGDVTGFDKMEVTVQSGAMCVH